MPHMCVNEPGQWNWNQNTNVFIQENAFENVVSEMAAILSSVDIECTETWSFLSQILQGEWRNLWRPKVMSYCAICEHWFNFSNYRLILTTFILLILSGRKRVSAYSH